MAPLSSIIDEIADIAGSLGASGEERTREIIFDVLKSARGFPSQPERSAFW